MRRRTTGITRRSRASAWNSSSEGQVVPKDSRGRGSATPVALLGSGGQQVVAVEAGPGAGVARRPDLVDPHEEGVAVAVQRHGVHVLHVTGGVSLAPVLPAAARP